MLRFCLRPPALCCGVTSLTTTRQDGAASGQGDTNYLGVDKKVDEAIAYLESIHDMKDWVPFKFDFETGKVKAE